MSATSEADRKDLPTQVCITWDVESGLAIVARSVIAAVVKDAKFQPTTHEEICGLVGSMTLANPSEVETISAPRQ